MCASAVARTTCRPGRKPSMTNSPRRSLSQRSLASGGISKPAPSAGSTCRAAPGSGFPSSDNTAPASRKPGDKRSSTSSSAASRESGMASGTRSLLTTSNEALSFGGSRGRAISKRPFSARVQTGCFSPVRTPTQTGLPGTCPTTLPRTVGAPSAAHAQTCAKQSAKTAGSALRLAQARFLIAGAPGGRCATSVA